MMPSALPRRTLLLIILLLAANLAALLWLGWQAWQAQERRYTDRADALLMAGDKAAAIAALDVHLLHNPGDADVAKRRDALEVQYRRDLLDRAHARLGADDRIGAVAALKELIERAPGDPEPQLELAKLYEELDDEEAAERVYREILTRAAGGPSAKIAADTAHRRLLRLVNRRANGLKRQADQRLRDGKFQDAASLYEQVIALRARNPALDTSTADRALALRALDEVVARRAFVVELLGEEPDPLQELQTEYDKDIAPPGRDPSVFLLARREARTLLLSDLHWEAADRAFNREAWEAAAENYHEARRLRPSSAETGHDLNLAALEYNLALSEFRLGRRGAALDRLERLAAQVPEYDKTKVAQLLKEIRDSLKKSGSR